MPMQIQRARSQWWRINHYDEPDFSRPLLEIPPEKQQRLLSRLTALYDQPTAGRTLPELERLIKVHAAHRPPEMVETEAACDATCRFNEKDMMLITYGDIVRAEGRTGLAALNSFLAAFRRGEPVFSVLHVLPFFPYTSDRGFSVLDFHSVDPQLGTWEDIRELGRTFRLMFDGVLNHASSKSKPFREMLSGNPDFRDYAVSFASEADITPEQRQALRRPRTSDVLTRFQAIGGPIWVWTTFSNDQIDLNYRNPRVLLSAVDTLLFYVRMGADLIRLDAVTYLWKELGTPSASLDETHMIVKLFRDVLDLAAPQVLLVTETNVPHAENTSYFGDGGDEAQLVYNFALPPLVLHAFYRGDASWLSEWAAGLEYPSETTSYLNILDTHDGIGLQGTSGILPPEEIQFLVERAREHGAFVSNRTTARGEEPYEINTTWYSALNLEDCGESRELQIHRFAASRSIALALRGIPAVYVHSLNGSRNDTRLALKTKVKRDVNRWTLDYDILQRNLADSRSKLHGLSEVLTRLFRARTTQAAFHPNGAQRILTLSPAVFALLRTSPSEREHVLCLTNVTGSPQDVTVEFDDLPEPIHHWFDLLAGRGWSANGTALNLHLNPYDVLWLTPFEEIERVIESRA